MAAFTINAGGTTLWDSLSAGSTNATLDTYTISNGTTLKIDTDSYQCANHSVAFGSLDTVSFAGIGGKLLLDGRDVRVIPFNTGTGTVPAIGTTISRGGVSGALLGVWANWQSEPLAAAAAMPATGWIKVRSLTTPGGITAGALTGISASATGPDVLGWIEVRGAETAQITVPRVGVFEVQGGWFQLGTTNGSRGQVLECPTTATVAGVFAGVWIETSAGSDVYERFPGVGTLAASASISTGERGKVVWQTTGGIRIGSDGTNNVGFLPPTGCKVRIPNVIMTCCVRTVSGSGPRVLPNATLATRQEFVTTAAGDININYGVMQWYANFLQAFRADIQQSVINDTVLLQEIASPINFRDSIVAPTQVQANLPMSMLSCFAGGVMSDVVLARATIGTAQIAICNYNKGVTFLNTKAIAFSNKSGTASASWSCTQSSDCSWYDAKVNGQFLLAGCTNILLQNLKFADLWTGTTGSGSGVYGIALTVGSRGIMLDGFSPMETDTHPYLGIMSITASYDWTIRNIGSYASPQTMGSANATGLIFGALGNSDGGRVQRVYVSNTRTGGWSTTNSDNDITLENVKCDYADTTVMAALNAIMKGVSLTGATTGQTSVYGTHFKDSFTSATVGKIEILCNEPSAVSAAHVVSTGGTPRYNSSGQVALTAIGDEVTWEMPYFAKGHSSLANLAPTLTGTNTGNLTYEFQYDFGSGYNGTWLTLNAANLSGAGAITPADGVRLKVRATCATAAAGNLLTNIAIPTVTSSTDQNQTYPLDVATITVEGLVTGSRIKATRGIGGSLITSMPEYGGVATFITDYVGSIFIEARKASGSPNYIPWNTLVTPLLGGTVVATAIQQLDE